MAGRHLNDRALTRRSLIGRGSLVTAGAVVGGESMSAPALAHGRRRGPAFKDVVIPLPNVVIAARVIGKGQTIVVHPSLGRGARDLDAMALELAGRGFRVITFDPRGCGETKAPESQLTGLTLHDYAADMRAVISHFRLRRTHVLGHAFGNRVTRMLAVDHPGVVKSVILCACGAGIPNTAALPDFLVATDSVSPVPQFERAIKASFFGAKGDPTPWYVGWYPDGVEAERTASLATEVSEYEGGGAGPMLIVQGLQDVIAPPSLGTSLRARYGADRITIRNIPGVGHAFPIERPRRTAEIIARYLRRS